jgi:hypothetical protein
MVLVFFPVLESYRYEPRLIFGLAGFILTDDDVYLLSQKALFDGRSNEGAS